MRISAIIPAHNPHPGRLRRALLGLAAQTVRPEGREVLLIDNASTSFPDGNFLAGAGVSGLRVVREDRLGLTQARRRGFAEARGEICVLVDDDNVLAPDYLEQALRFLDREPRVGAAGGACLPEFEVPPEPWQSEFLGLLALRDLGAAERVSAGLRNAAGENRFPDFAPVGAGLVVRKSAADAWARVADGRGFSDRRGSALSSSGDNDLVLTVMADGWEVAYVPALRLTHLIPAGRLDPAYLGRLNRGIQRSWMRVLTYHRANPWPELGPVDARLRQARSWMRRRPWASPAARVRWQGDLGHFEGRMRGART